MSYSYDQSATRIPGRSPVASESEALVPISDAVLTGDSETQALAAGVDVGVIEAIKTGVPYWRVVLPGVPERVAPVLGITADDIRIAHAKAQNKVFGRHAGAANGFQSTGTSGFGGIRTS